MQARALAAHLGLLRDAELWYRPSMGQRDGQQAGLLPIQRAAAALAAIDGPGSFCARRSMPIDALEMSVADVGRIRLPLTPQTAERLVAAAEPAPFGRGEETLYDPTVRDAWQIPGDAIDIYWPIWNHHLADVLADFHDDLGLPDGTLCAELDKLLIYGPGQFFAPHRDSERSDEQVQPRRDGSPI